MVWLVSVSLVTFPITVLPVTSVIPENNPEWLLIYLLMRVFGLAIFMATLLTFPDGRFRPAWTRFVFAGWMVYSIVWLLVPELSPPTAFIDMRDDLNLIRAIPTLLTFFLIVVAQVYRYKRLYNSVQRQQTRWVVAGITFTLALTFLLFTPLMVTPDLRGSTTAFTAYLLLAIPLIVIAFSLFPLSIAIAILRYRLWDVDVVIRKTLVYSALTGSLALIYFASVVFLGQLFQLLTGENSPAGIVISTLIIAALFTPLRRRIQDFIDRRFFRRKYNAEAILIAFANKARNEVDIHELSQSMVEAVEDTVQPEQVYLWIKPAILEEPTHFDRKNKELIPKQNQIDQEISWNSSS
jgi:hypothetical protein